MEFGILLQSAAPVRSEPSHKAEMVTQLLFGELVRILFRDKDWMKVQTEWDDYEGWTASNQLTILEETEFLTLVKNGNSFSHDLVQLVSNQSTHAILPVVLGSTLPGVVNGEFSILGENYFFDGETAPQPAAGAESTAAAMQKLRQQVVSDAMLYLNSPYLWGGRSPFGIDCSGLVQMVFKLNGIRLLRDASRQAMQGETLNFLSETEPGDLAFFDNEEGTIIHTGILLDPSKILHASGRVRIDTIDHQGIYNACERRYTHNLRVIKRMI